MRKCVVLLFAAAAILVLTVTGCSSGNSKKMTPPQKEALQELLGSEQEIADEAIKGIELTEEVKEKFPAVKNAYEITCGEQKNYAFLSSPLGYRSAIDLFVLIDGEKNELLGIRVLQHDETPLYGGDSLTKEWFLDRFNNKSAGAYLNRVVLEPSRPNDIIQITCATVSSQAVINGVNAAMGTYRELLLGEEAEPVPLKVEGFVTEIQ
ncbi:electron transport complex protein RnfG [Pelotomaculum schinkii]|uniref:Electron transport complex protein RnfG n=1 Tax=Pelotomaculum schinkii TaxID=78350 RepID=A0A4Y7RGD1_9FIRM|nr:MULTISPECIES: FMN-binding protein [Pelotomaculum]TEB08068.1 electron transport complex protein RnfG [Pelotomaculum schinkii]TEB15760.1 electron transport complex protein RnfG [Pelotomaculum sp. FP]